MDADTIETMMSAESVEWMTPLWLYEMLDDQFHFELDVAASDANHLCDSYYTMEHDGLLAEWTRNFWCNPPYGNAEEVCAPGCTKKRCIAPKKKRKDGRVIELPPRGHITQRMAGCMDFAQRGVEMVEKYGVLGCYLVPSRTDTEWFAKLWSASSHVWFIKGRLRFDYLLNGKRTPGQTAPFPSTVFILEPRARRAANPLVDLLDIPRAA
jgi:phage N-6-adenine-methyltransferase